MPNEKPADPLWKLAQKRARFKSHLTAYVLVNLFLWAIWWFTMGYRGISSGPVAWPVWVLLGWGLGLAFQYFDAYGDMDQKSATQKEYERLKKQEERKSGLS
jgi:hypothetical protein